MSELWATVVTFPVLIPAQPAKASAASASWVGGSLSHRTSLGAPSPARPAASTGPEPVRTARLFFIKSTMMVALKKLSQQSQIL